MKTVYIILAFCAGLFLGHLFFPSEKVIKPPVYVQLNDAKEKLAKIDNGYTLEQSEYKTKNDSLIKELKGYKFLLATAREQLKGKREKTFAIVDRIKRDTLYKCDTALVDSLSDQIASVNQSTDSLITSYQQQDSILECMVAIRDSQIVICNNNYLEVKNLAQDQLMREQKLTDDLNTALKQQKRKLVQNKVLAAGMLFVSGITTTLYIKSRH